MELRIDLEALDACILYYEKYLKELENYREQLDAVKFGLFSCWTGFHAENVKMRLNLLIYGYENSLTKLQLQAEGIHHTLLEARRGMNVQKNRCSHFIDMLADEAASPEQSYPEEREGPDSQLYINYDGSLQMVDALQQLLDNELSLEPHGPGQMGAWNQMYQHVRLPFLYCRNLSGENKLAVKQLTEQYQKIGNLAASLTHYHMGLYELEQQLCASFAGYDTERNNLEERQLYTLTLAGQEKLGMEALGFCVQSGNGMIQYNWKTIAYALGKPELSEAEARGLCQILDQISTLPEAEQEPLLQLFISNCHPEQDGLPRFLYQYQGHITQLALEEQGNAVQVLGTLLKQGYVLTDLDNTGSPEAQTASSQYYSAALMDLWLSPNYKLTKEERGLAHEIIEKFWGNRRRISFNFQEVMEQNRYEAQLRSEQPEQCARITALEAKISRGTAIATGIFEMVPFFERSYDWSIETSAKMQGIEPPPVSSFQYLKANVQVQNGKYYIGGYVTGQVVTYAAASEVVKGLPFVGKAIGNAAERLSHLPILNHIGAGHLQNILGGLAVDVVVDTAPETVDDILEGESVKDIAANTSLNVLENLGWNIAGEGVITGLGKVAEYVGGKWILKGVEGGSGTLERGLKSSFAQDIDQVLAKQGITIDEFNSLRLQDISTLTAEEKTTLKAIRESVPTPDTTTLMQKVIPASDIGKYIDGSYTQVGGYVTRAEDVVQLNTYDDLYNSLRLDYPNSAYKPMADDSIGVIRYTTDDVSNISVPYGTEMGGTVTEGPPFTGNGFTKATNGEIIPEFKCKGYLEVSDGAELLEISKDGTETLRAIYSEVKGRFVPIELRKVN